MSQAEPRPGAVCLTLQQLSSALFCSYTASRCSARLLPPLTSFCKTGAPDKPLPAPAERRKVALAAGSGCLGAARGRLQTASNRLSETALVCFIPNLHHEQGLRSVAHRLPDYLKTKPKAKQLHFQRGKRKKKKRKQEPS